MSGQNTEKQILAMVILLVISVASLGAYTWFDNGRRTEAASEVFERDAERGAHIFARNCRVCHGNDGRGTDSSSSLVGPALNKPSNTFAWRTENAGQLAALQNDYRFTIACGRNGTPMPPWSLDQGGSLDDYKIDTLVTLITTNAGNGWAVALEAAIHEDELSIGNLEIALGSAESVVAAGGWSHDLEAALAAVAAAEANDAELSRLRAALVDAEAALDALNEEGADAEAIAAAESSLEAAGTELADFEKPYTRLVLDVIRVATGDPNEDEEAIGAARERLAGAREVAREIAEQRAWRKVLTDLATAQDNLHDAEERFASGLPIMSPPAQVTVGTCGQVSAYHSEAAFDDLGGWLASLRSEDS